MIEWSLVLLSMYASCALCLLAGGLALSALLWLVGRWEEER